MIILYLTPTTLILILYLISCTLQKYQKQFLFRSVTVPISVLHGVPYLQFRQICSADVYQQQNNYNFAFWDQQHSSQFQQLTNYHQQSYINVLIDTGSNQFWLADSACQKCSFKKSLCPHLSTSERKINYMKGFIEGVDSYMNICGNRIKYLCVKSSQGLSQLKGQGILGLKYNSTGLNIIKNIIDKKSRQKRIHTAGTTTARNRQSNFIVEQKYQFVFDYGTVFNNLIIRQVKNIFISQQHMQDYQKQKVYVRNNEIKLKTGRNWQFLVDRIMLFNNHICINCNKQYNNPIKAYMDTGSSKIVFSSNLCISLLTQIQQKFNTSCKYHQPQGIDCNRIIKSMQVQMVVNSEQTGSSQQNDNKQMVLQISSRYVLDPSTNRINIICQQPSQQEKQQKIIVGYPFLRSYLTTFVISSIKNKEQNQKQEIQNLIHIKPYGINTQYYQLRVLKVMMVGYLTMVVVMGWAFVLFLDYIRDKRSKKIII